MNIYKQNLHTTRDYIDFVSPNHWYTKLLYEYTLQILSLSFSHHIQKKKVQ